MKNDLPSDFADQLGLEYTNSVNVEHKKRLGQYFTPKKVASFIASQIKYDQKVVKILDPGCGVGILSCALIESLVNLHQIKEVELHAFETDLDIIPFTERVYSYLRNWLLNRKVEFKYVIATNDFITSNSKVLADKDEKSTNQYDIVIINPPYFKIGRNDERAIAAKSIIYGQTNIYSIFLMLSARLLKESGMIAFITPRSFASGSYFRLFREKFFSLITPTFFHLFESRKNTFQRDNVLQENIIICGIKKIQAIDQLMIPFSEVKDPEVVISVSSTTNDLTDSKRFLHKLSSVIDLNSKQRILHIPTSSTENEVIKVFRAWKNNLTEMGYDISTGPVVAFRSEDEILFDEELQSVPLIWLHNISKMKFNWPIAKAGKGQYIKLTKTSLPKLVANKNYVLVRRFSSKDDKSRLIACPYFSKSFDEKSRIGIENHLNYIYKFLGDLEEIELLGISGLLNSSLFDSYFRTFNGNTNVSVTDLKNIPFPDKKILLELGKVIKKKGLNKISQKFIDTQLDKLLLNVVAVN